MKACNCIVSTLIVTVLFFTASLEGRGGRGSAFHGDTDKNSSSQIMLSPTMSRADESFSPQIATLPLNKESQLSIAKPMGIPLPERTPKADTFNRLKEENPDHFRQLQGITSAVRHNVEHEYPHYKQWFGDVFQKDHPNSFYASSEDFNFWQQNTWANVVESLTEKPSNPIYYDYGDEGNVVYHNDNKVYIDGEPSFPIQMYNQQAKEIAESGPAPGDSPEHWLSLGVFALTTLEASVNTPNMYLQLALSEKGDISGTYFNALTDKTQILEGMLESQSQRVAWKVSDNPETPIFETGLFNLTQESANAMVHFPDGSTQIWTMVQLGTPIKN